MPVSSASRPGTNHQTKSQQTLPCVVIRGGDDPGQGSTHLTIDHFLARGRKTEHWPRSRHVHFDEWQDRYYSETNGQNAPRSCGAITGTYLLDINPDSSGVGSPTHPLTVWKRGARARKSTGHLHQSRARRKSTDASASPESGPDGSGHCCPLCG
jgi:hypothetical protein